MRSPFNHRDWYWLAEDGRVYASARQVQVGADDAGLAAFRAAGLVPTPWPRDEDDQQTDAALQAVLDDYGLCVSLAVLKATLSAQVDARAEAIRGTLATPGAGQAMEYQEVQAQAVAALKAPSTANADKYPMLAATIGIDVDPSTKAPATDVLGVARSVDAARQAWVRAGAFIRATRLAGKAAVAEAQTAAAAQAAFEAVSWDLPSQT